jgi:hypothetical protein
VRGHAGLDVDGDHRVGDDVVGQTSPSANSSIARIQSRMAKPAQAAVRARVPVGPLVVLLGMYSAGSTPAEA